ncbi:hypothetical protein CHS0354_028427 [Potamilus streckersoni]|uniref:Uncharacterized protein n=1 Tax=Potamilus streckersoni TaxID=2493646 RepID=A0AAE0SGM1_9BIVA|nr:hypothetical protein CHS0354_028427 [Potamilus streckersoni]
MISGVCLFDCGGLSMCISVKDGHRGLCQLRVEIFVFMPNKRIYCDSVNSLCVMTHKKMKPYKNIHSVKMENFFMDEILNTTA